MGKTLITALLLCSAVHATTSSLLLRHRESGGVGYSKGYSSLDYMLTAQGGLSEFLLDLRGHVFNDGRVAGNAGAGFRYGIYDDAYRIGTNLFYDFRSTKHFFANQVGGGLEFLSDSADFRINGYLPTGKNRQFEEKKFQNFAGNHAFIYKKLHVALPCIDAEVGIPFAAIGMQPQELTICSISMIIKWQPIIRGEEKRGWRPPLESMWGSRQQRPTTRFSISGSKGCLRSISLWEKGITLQETYRKSRSCEMKSSPSSSKENRTTCSFRKKIRCGLFLSATRP